MGTSSSIPSANFGVTQTTKASVIFGSLSDVNSFEVAYIKIPDVIKELRNYPSVESGEIQAPLDFLAKYCSITRYGRDIPLIWCAQLQKHGLIPALMLMWPSIFVPDLINATDDTNSIDADLIRLKYENLKKMIHLFWNSTDTSPVICKELCERECISTLVQLLTRPDFTVQAVEDSNNKRSYIYRALTGILHNCMRHQNALAKDSFRASNGLEIMQRYLTSKNKNIRFRAGLLLAHSVTEEEATLLYDLRSMVTLVVKALDTCMARDTHRAIVNGSHFSAEEVMLIINYMAVNDEIKNRLATAPFLNLYAQAILYPLDDQEQLTAVKGIWTFSFHEKLKEQIKELEGCTLALDKLQHSENAEMRKAAEGALWNLLDKSAQHARKSSAKANAEKGRRKSSAGSVGEPKLGHLMISYDWGHKQLALKLNETLKLNGYLTWMDVDQMSGSTLEAMACAIEQASIFLMCVSERYKESPSCRAEAEYAYKLNVPIIPIRMQHRYQADGWLGIVQGTKLYFECTSVEVFEEMLPRLLKELQKQLKLPSNSGTDLSLPRIISKKGLSKVVTPTGFTSWTVKDVEKWLQENQLGHLCNAFNTFDGALLHDLRSMCEKAPSVYYKCLQEELGITSLPDLLRLSRHLQCLK